ncbi:IS110 family transposase, partial [Sutterella seckii]
NTDRASIDAFAAWCRECNPDIILMESTGSLWQSPYEALERAGFTSEQLALINARDAKAAAGRKTDRKDASRLASLARTGNFKKSFVPEKAFRLQRVIPRDLQKNRNDISRTSNRFGKSLISRMPGLQRYSATSAEAKAASLILMAKLRDDPHLFDVIKQNSRRCGKP